MRGGRSLLQVALAGLIVGGCASRLPAGAGSAQGSPTANPVSAPDATGCSVPPLPLENVTATPGITRGRPQPLPILRLGERLNSLDDPALKALAPVMPKMTPNGQPLQAVIFDPTNDADETDGKLNPAVYLYFSKGPIQEQTTIVDVYAGGGGFLEEVATHGQDATFVKSAVGDSATIIKVGTYDAAFDVSSPWPGGFYTHGLYWSDGVRDFGLVVNGAADEVVKVAQSIYC